MPRRSKHASIDDIIAHEVRRALARQLATARAERPPTSRRAAARTGHRSGAAPVSSSGSPTSAATAAQASSAAPAIAEARAAAPASTSSGDIVDRVRKEFALAYDGRPVSPDRLAFRLKADRVLVDAALTYLVTRKEARMTAVRGKVGYMPLRLR